MILADSDAGEDESEEENPDEEESGEPSGDDDVETVLDARYHTGEKYGNLRGLHETTVKNLTTLLVTKLL